MNYRNEYERLKAEGYTEEEIRVELDSLSRLSISKEPLAENRDDRGVVAADASGVTKKTSSIMMGYNKKNIQLENGEYLSYEDFKDALEEVMSHDDENVVYVCKKTGKKIETSHLSAELFEQIVNETSSFNITESKKVTNQTAASITINEPKLNKLFSKGLLMLGNIGLKLPNGQYVKATEIQKALDDYVKLTPKKDESPFFPIIDHYESDDKKEEPKKKDLNLIDEDNMLDEVIYKVILRYQKYIPKEILALIMAIMMFLSMIKMREQEIINKVTIGEIVAPHSITRMVDNDLNYVDRSTVQLSTGEKVKLDSGTEFYGSSDHAYGGNDSKGVVGSGIRQEGEYTAEYFSFLYNGKIIGTQMDKNVDLQENLEKIAKERNISADEIEVHVHFGGPTCGWVRLDDILNKLPADQVEMEIEGATYEGVANEINGKTISIDTESGPVTIEIFDANGNLLEPGTIVKGSDGNDYKINALSLDTVTTTKTEITTEKKLTFSIKNITLNDVIITALATALAALLLRKKKKVMTEMTNEQILELIEEARKEYSNDSEFDKATRTIIGDKDIGDKTSIDALREALIAQETTVEDIRNIGGAKK